MNDASLLRDEMAESLLAGELAEGDAEAASRALAQGTGAVRELAGALLVHGLLAARQTDCESAVAAISRRLDAAGRRRPSARRWARWGAALAAAALLAAAAAVLLARRWQAEPAGAQVLSGTLAGLESGEDAVPFGRAVATGDAPATLACGDGSRVEMAPGSALVIHGRTGGDRWRIELATGAVECHVPAGQHPFRVCTRAGDVVTEGTRFAARLAQDAEGRWGLAVSVAQGAVRVERPPLGSARVVAGGLRLFPPPAPSGEGAALALQLLFPGEDVRGVAAKLDRGQIELEGTIGGLEVEAEVAPDGSVQSYSRELPPSELPGALPAAVRDALRARFGQEVQWLEADREVRGGATFYEVTLRVGGKEAEVKLDASGNFVRGQDDD